MDDSYLAPHVNGTWRQRFDVVCTEGIVDAGVVDLVWGQAWRPATVDALRAAQHGVDQSAGVTLPTRAVVACFNTHLPQVLEVLARDGVGGKYVVISRDGDPPLQDAMWPSCVHHIFAINVMRANPRVTPMPTGSYAFTNDSSLDVVPRGRQNRVLVSYSLDMPGSVYGEGHERIRAIEHFRDKPWATVNERLLGWSSRTGPVWPSWSWFEYINKLREHDYVAVPVGYGVDRMAAWEAMALGTIPICLWHSELAHFADMPIAFVDKWEDVTPEWCDAHLGVIDRSIERMRLSYWVDKIRAKREELFTT